MIHRKNGICIIVAFILSYSYQKRKNFGTVSWKMCLVERYTSYRALRSLYKRNLSRRQKPA